MATIYSKLSILVVCLCSVQMIVAGEKPGGSGRGVSGKNVTRSVAPRGGSEKNGKSVDLDALYAYLLDPQVRALLDVIAYAEGTVGKNSYRTIFGFKEFSDFDDHPRCIVCAPSNGKVLCSSAAGRYQFCQNEWDRVSHIIGAKNFTPFNQDCGAVYLLMEKHAILPLKQGDFSQALFKIKAVWASIPGAPYHQPTKKEDELKRIYAKRLAFHQNKLLGRYHESNT